MLMSGFEVRFREEFGVDRQVEVRQHNSYTQVTLQDGTLAATLGP